MTSLIQHNKDCILLAKSLVIKFSDVAIAVNNGLISKYDMTIPTDRKQWKYYMNLAGIKHSTNNDVIVNVMEVGERLPLSRELLEKYSYTRTELLKNGESYDNLINEFPNDITFINGCLYPVDIEKAITSKDGDILNYNTTLIEKSEYKLIKELEEHVKLFLTRWHVREYGIVDELYVPAMLGILYSSLPNKIMNIRMERIHTNEAHSFHLEHFFRSNISMWDNITILSEETKYWLYKNLPYLVANIGKEEIFKIVIDKILNPNSVGIGTYYIRKPNNKPNTNKGKFDPTFVHSDIVVNSAKLNSYYVDNSEGLTTLSTIINSELNINKEELTQTQKEYNEFLVTDSVKIISNTNRDMQKTKILELSTYQLFKKQGIDLFKMILDYVMYLQTHKKINYLVEFIEPNDNKNYILTGETAILFIIKLLINLSGNKDLKLTKLTYDTVLKPDSTILREAYSKLWVDGYTEMFFKDLEEHYPNILKSWTSPSDAEYLISSVVEYYSYIWTLDANFESSICSANIKYLMNLVMDRGDYVLTTKEGGMTIDELLEEKGMKYEITNTFDLSNSLSTLLMQLTNVNINEFAIIAELSTGFKTLVDKLTSYSTQCLLTDVGENMMYIYYNITNVLNTRYGIANITNGDLRGLEENYTKIKTYANNFSDDCIYIETNNMNVRSATIQEWPIKGHVYIDKNEEKVMLAPSFGVEVMKDCYVGINKGNYSNDFWIQDVKATMYASENENIEVTTSSNTDDNNITFANIFNNPLDINATSAELSDWPIKGSILVDSGLDVDNVTPTITTMNPNFSVEFKDDPVVSITKGSYKNKFLKELKGSMTALEDEQVNITSKANDNNKDDISYANIYDNPINMNARSAEEKVHPITLTMYIEQNIKANLVALPLQPNIQVEVIDDVKVGVNKSKYTEKFILDVSASMEALSSITPRVLAGGSYVDTYSEKLATSNIEPIANCKIKEDKIKAMANIVDELAITVPNIQVQIDDKKK